MRKLIFLLLLIVSVVRVYADDKATLRADAPEVVVSGDQFRLEFTVNTQKVKDFRVPSIKGFDVLMGPSRSMQSSTQVINGKVSSTSSITYTYFLTASDTGTYTIPAASIEVNGEKVFSNAITIKVLPPDKAGNNSGHSSSSRSSSSSARGRAGQISGNELFIAANASKTNVHEQEAILLTYKVYTSVNLRQLHGDMPDMKGFHTQEIPLPQQKSFHIEKLNGRSYRCVTWSQYVMYPQMTGKMTIPSLTFKGVVVMQNRNVDPFEAFFNGGSGYIEVKRNIVAPAIDIQVDPLPQKPADFSGGVGRFSISSQLLSNTVKAGAPVTLRVVVGGNGNLKLIKQPVVTFPKDFDKYDPKVTDKTKLTTNGLEGNMVYDFLVVPRNHGNYTSLLCRLLITTHRATSIRQ